MEPDSMLLGTIARLQVERAPLKVGEGRLRYDPAPISEVDALTVTPAGVTARTAEGFPLCDVHHQHHPMSRNSKGKNGISLGFTGHYAAMRGHFGDHITDGIAGENILIDVGRLVEIGELERGLRIVTAEGQEIKLDRIVIAEPCVEFSRFAARFPHDAPSDRTVSDAVLFLRGGVRGFYASYAGDPVTMRQGDRVYRLP